MLGVSAVVVRDGRVLLVRRARGAFVGRWSLPGGKVEHGEPLAEAVRREAREETGLDVEVGEQVWIREQTSDPDHYVIVVFRAEVTGGELEAGDDSDDAAWVEPSEVAARPTTPGLTNTLRAAGLDVGTAG